MLSSPDLDSFGSSLDVAALSTASTAAWVASTCPGTEKHKVSLSQPDPVCL